MTQLYPYPVINPDENQLILFLGRKGSGKSVNAFETFRAWPNVDKLVIDPTGDADPGEVLAGGVRPTTVRELPDSLPMPARAGEHVALRYTANPASKSYREDLDRALGLALYPKNRRTLTWIDEAGEVFPANQTGPNGRVMLQQSRHWYSSVLMCCPRPITINPLCLAQADRVVMYDLPHPADRERVAGAIGIAPKVLNAELDAMRARGKYWHLVYIAEEHEMYLVPPMTVSAGYKHAQQ